jgi:hypothetical protein
MLCVLPVKVSRGTFFLSGGDISTRTSVRQIAVERGANRQAMRLASEVGMAPESQVALRQDLKKSFKSYKTSALMAENEEGYKQTAS